MAFDAGDLEEAIAAVLKQAGLADARRVALAQDASTRSYERLELGGRRAILMKAPPGSENPPCPPLADRAERERLGWNATSRLAASRVEAFVAVGAHLRSLGYSAPEVHAADFDAGVAVVEDLGEGLFANVIPDGAEETELYAAAGRLLADLHARPVPETVGQGRSTWSILDFDRQALEVNVDLYVDFASKFLGLPELDEAAVVEFRAIRDDLIDEALTYAPAFTLRDYHAENVLWLPDRSGHARIGLLDFQDAVRGFRGWDFAMLLHDARRDVAPEAHEACVRAYLDVSGGARETFDHELAVLGAMNALRILGVFCRLVWRDGKGRYRQFMPREAGHLRAVLAHPRLSAMRAWVDRHAPLDAFAAV